MKKLLITLFAGILLTGCAVQAMEKPQQHELYSNNNVSVQITTTLPTEDTLDLNFTVLSNTEDKDIFVRISRAGEYGFSMDEAPYYNLNDYEGFALGGFQADDIELDFVVKSPSDDFALLDSLVIGVGQ